MITAILPLAIVPPENAVQNGLKSLSVVLRIVAYIIRGTANVTVILSCMFYTAFFRSGNRVADD